MIGLLTSSCGLLSMLPGTRDFSDTKGTNNHQNWTLQPGRNQDASNLSATNRWRL